MSHITSETPQIVAIYTNKEISIDFYQLFEDSLKPILFTIKTLEQIPSMEKNKINIIILESWDELHDLQLNCSKLHLIIPIHSNNRLENNLNALVFEHDQSMTSQQALEKLYHSFIKFYFSAKYHLDPQDLFKSNSDNNGHQYLKMHDILQNDADYEKQLNTYLKTISDTETVCFNFSISYDFPSESGYLPLLEDTVDHLTYARNRDVFFSTVLSKHPISDNKLSIIHLSQESPMS